MKLKSHAYYIIMVKKSSHVPKSTEESIMNKWNCICRVVLMVSCFAADLFMSSSWVSCSAGRVSSRLVFKYKALRCVLYIAMPLKMALGPKMRCSLCKCCITWEKPMQEKVAIHSRSFSTSPLALLNGTCIHMGSRSEVEYSQRWFRKKLLDVA